MHYSSARSLPEIPLIALGLLAPFDIETLLMIVCNLNLSMCCRDMRYILHSSSGAP